MGILDTLMGGNTAETAQPTGKYGSVDKISIKGLTQTYKDKDGHVNTVFDNTEFSIKDVAGKGQFVVLVGQSGCGKSTILRYIAGLQKPTAGEIYINGKLKTEDDRIGMVEQRYSSLPWMTVLENVMLPLKIAGETDVKKMREVAMNWIQLMDLEKHANKYAQYPRLSGGQLQRVAIARNLAANKEILLMDEPFGALDIRTRLKMQDLLCDVWTKMPGDPTILLVTHDLSEAVYLADEIYVMSANPGKVAKVIDIKLPDARTNALKRTREFQAYVNELEDIMISLNS